MELHFCSRCGISIPQSEIDGGNATGAGGKYFCSEHRGGASVAVAENPRSAGADSPGGVPGEDPELLFCANCRVSIPQDDSKSGRAHREFGSLLCAGCSKADPGERAARREAVEAEMAADVDAQDPVVARRCGVCSAAVPYAQIATGKAKVEGNRVVCERCRVAAGAVPAAAPREGGSSVLTVVIVAAAALGVGYFATQAWIDQKKATTAGAAEAATETKSLRSYVDRRFDEMKASLDETSKRAALPDEAAEARRKLLEADLANVRQMVADLRADAAKGDVELAQRVAKLEGQIAEISSMVHGIASRGPAPSSPPPVERPPEPPTATNPPAANPPSTEPSKPESTAINPEVAKHCKDLLESQDDGTRFTAATELTRLKDPAAIPSLVKALGDDKHYFVRRGCARALGVMKAWLAVPSLIRALEDREVYVALAADIALTNITGWDPGVTQDTPAGQRKTKAQAADKWWEKNKDKPPEGVSLHPITD
jgi:hypothetical protein